MCCSRCPPLDQGGGGVCHMKLVAALARRACQCYWWRRQLSRLPWCKANTWFAFAQPRKGTVSVKHCYSFTSTVLIAVDVCSRRGLTQSGADIAELASPLCLSIPAGLRDNGAAPVPQALWSLVGCWWSQLLNDSLGHGRDEVSSACSRALVRSGNLSQAQWKI